MPVYKPDVFDRLTDKTEAKIKGLRRRWALSSLEKSIAKALTITDGHKKAGVPAGDMRYQSIAANVDLEILAFCDKYQVDRAHIDAQVPGLKLLRDMSIPGKQIPKPAIVMLVLVALVLLLTCIGAALGYVNAISHLITRIF